MNDKEMIEEMANCDKCACKELCESYKYIDFVNLPEDLLRHKEYVKKNGCRYYQPKLPEDSVVLSKEEYYELKQAKKLLEIVKEEINNLADANIKYSIALENKDKDTTEKVIKKVREMLDNCETIYENDEHLITPNVGYLMKDVDDGLDEIEKQLNVEIKE